MNREGFLEAVKKQYAEEIQSAYFACEHEDELNHKSLNKVELEKKLFKIMKSAAAEGLNSKDFEELVFSTIPEVGNQLNFKKAA